jgi:DNA/RNA endonuclease YhcR with UshA esterase domain
MIDEDYVWLFDEVLGSHFEEDLVGEIVWAFGRVEIYEGQPEIKPTAPDQLQLECPVECDRVSCK